MELAGDIIKKRFDAANNDNNDNNDNIEKENIKHDINGSKYNNDTNAANNKSYALDKSKFTPNTEQTTLAEEIAKSFNDLQNYACYLSVVKKIGVVSAMRLHKSTLSDIVEKKDTKYPVRSKPAYFMWKYKNKKF